MTSDAITPPVAPPGPGLDPTLALALGLSSSPGAYALLLGSGVSRAARVPTGWEVVLDLIRKVAALQGGDAERQAQADAEGWWRGQGYGDPRYDTLLEALAPTAPARRDLLNGYFEPSGDAEREAGVKQPTKAHRAIAELAASGRVRLILTTNFDRLTETALAEAGVPPQVISRGDAIAGMAPLQHARATVIKLHGDYLDVQAIRNTPAELASYEPAMSALLARILDEYGLIVAGWSGEWDTALVRAIEDCQARRYPVYWAAHQGAMSPAAAKLLAGRAGHLIPVDGADSFFGDLRDKVTALDRMADPPPTRAVAVATLKRNLRPDRAVELFDQLNLATNRAIDRLDPGHYPVTDTPMTAEDAAAELAGRLASYDSDTDVLAALAAAAVFHRHAGDPRADDLIVRAVRRLAEPGPLPPAYADFLFGARRYPALRVATCAGVAAVASGREGLLFRLLAEARSPLLAPTDPEVPLVTALYPRRVLVRDDVTRLLPQLARPGGPRWPASSCLQTGCRAALQELADDREYAAAFDRYEYLRGMLEIAYDRDQRAALGEFATRAGGIPPEGEITGQWPLVVAGAFDGSPDSARAARAKLTDQIDRLPFR